MPRSRMARIKDAEEAAQDFTRAAEEVRKKLATVEDPETRKELIEAVSELERYAKQLRDGLHGMRKSLQ